MALSNFPDVNVWLALILEHHVHHTQAVAWWGSETAAPIAWMRFTQMGVLRLLTTSSAMDSRPLSMSQAWLVVDKFYEDDRVVLHSQEPPGFEADFRQLSSLPSASPKVWMDAYLIAFASNARGRVITFDRALERSGADCLVLA